MKFIKIIALLMLSLFILSSCSQVGENNQSDTEQTVDDMQFKLEMPSKELQERFEREYVAYMNYDPENHPTVAIEYWFGSFGDIHFLYVFDGNLMYDCAVWVEVIADNEFVYRSGQRIMVWIDGQFIVFKTAYEQGLITEDMVATIANIHNESSGSPISVYANSEWRPCSPPPIIRTPSNDDYTVELPKEEFLSQIETTYSEYYKNKYNYDTTFRIQKYYGTYDGVTAFVIWGDGIIGDAASYTETIAGYTFTYGGSTRIEIMKNGEFFDMKDAYDKGIITEEYVAAVYNCTPAEYNIYT